MTRTAQSQVYDVIIVVGGPAGLFAAYYLSEHSTLKILLIEKGKPPLKRILTNLIDGPGVAGNIVSAAATALISAKEIIHRHAQGHQP